VTASLQAQAREGLGLGVVALPGNLHSIRVSYGIDTDSNLTGHSNRGSRNTPKPTLIFLNSAPW